MGEWVPVKAPVLSPSSINTFRQCPLKFKYEKIDKRRQPGTVETLKGSFVHEILEYLFKEPAENRTTDTAKAIAAERWAASWQKKVRKLISEDRDLNNFKWQSWWLVENYFKMEDPSTIEPVGLERWVDGPVINGIRVRGIIDRLIKTEEGLLVIQDYKTGKTPRENDPWEADKIFPLMVYADLAEAETETEVSSMELLYLQSGKVIEFSPTEKNREAMYRRVIETSAAVDEACQTGNFPPSKSKLCDWCFFKKECPAWKNDAK